MAIGPALTTDQNILPVQAYFNLDGSFNTFLGQGQPFVVSATESIGIIDTTVSGTFYPTFSAVNTGQVTTLSVTSTKLSFNPSTGVLTANGGFVGSLNGIASIATNLQLGGANTLVYQSSSGNTAYLTNGTTGQVLTATTGSAPSWTTPTFYASVTDDTTTNTTRYPLFANQTSGSITTEYTSSTKYQYNPSTGTLSATIFSGSGASLTSIPNSALTNSSITLGSTAISLGGTATTIAGLTSVTSTTFVGALTGNASTATTATTATNATNIGITDNTSSSATWYPTIVSNTTGNLPATTSSTKLSFVPSTGTLNATVFSGSFTGSWTGSVVTVPYGGTGLSSLTANYIPYGNGTSAFQSSSNLQFTGTNLLLNQSTDQGTGVLQVTGQSTFNGAVTDKSLNLQGGNNLLKYSNDLTQSSAWTQLLAGSASAPLKTANYATAPDNSTTASRLVLSRTGTTAGDYSGLIQTTVLSSASFTYSVWFKSNTASSQNIAWGDSASVSYTPAIVTTSWQKFTITTTQANPSLIIITRGGAFSSADLNIDILVWCGQIEYGTVASSSTVTTTAAVTTTNNISVPSGAVTSNSYSINGGTGFYGSSTGAEVGSAGSYSFSSTTSSSGTADTYLYRDAANTLAQRNSTNAQTFRLYNTYTDASNYERLSIDWSTTANTATISTQNAGTGSARNLAIGQDLYVNGARIGRGGGNLLTNTYIGNGSAGNAVNTGSGGNVGLGYSVLANNTSGDNNSIVGLNAMFNNTSGSKNTGIGSGVFGGNVSGGFSSAFGYLALQNNTTASNLTAIGTQALQANTTNVATLGTITGGSSYTNGTYTGVVMTLSSGSTAITYPTATIVVAGGVVTTVTITSAGVGFKDTTTVLTAPAASIGGTGSGFSVPVATLQSGTGNVAVGYQAGYTNSTGTNNTFTGYQAGYTNSTGSNNTFTGYLAGYSNTTGITNSAFGHGALYAVTTGGYNSAFGQNTLNSATGNFNSGFGRAALYSQTSGNNNTAFGYGAGYAGSANANTTGSNNTYIGYNTVGSGIANTNEMVIGYQAVGLGSNTTVIGNSSTTLTKVFGTIQATTYTVATLPSASTSGVGARAFVTDALAPVFGATVVTGGAVATPVYSDGAAWKVG